MVQPACDPEVFAELSEHFVELQSSTGEFKDSNDLELVQTRRYTVDVVTFADTWIGCQNYVNSLNKETNVHVDFLESRAVGFLFVCLIACVYVLVSTHPLLSLSLL
jgi:hypothetical protein